MDSEFTLTIHVDVSPTSRASQVQWSHAPAPLSHHILEVTVTEHSLDEGSNGIVSSPEYRSNKYFIGDVTLSLRVFPPR